MHIAALRTFSHQTAHHGYPLHSTGLPPTSTGVTLQYFIQEVLLDWMEAPLPPLLYYGQRAPKRYASLQTSLTSSIFRASELPYSTWRTFSALHSPRYAPPPSHGRSLKRPSALLAGSSLDERVAHRHFHFVSNSGKLKEKQRDTRTPKEKPGKQHTNKKRKKQPGQLTF